jgi:hypothetical protein
VTVAPLFNPEAWEKAFKTIIRKISRHTGISAYRDSEKEEL